MQVPRKEASAVDNELKNEDSNQRGESSRGRKQKKEQGVAGTCETEESEYAK